MKHKMTWSAVGIALAVVALCATGAAAASDCKPGTLAPGDPDYQRVKRSPGAFPCSNGCVASLLRDGQRMNLLGVPCRVGMMNLSELLRNDLQRFPDYRQCMVAAVGADTIAAFERNDWALFPPHQQPAVVQCKKIAECHIDPKKCGP